MSKLISNESQLKLTDKELSAVEKLFNKIDKSKEFEVMFYNYNKDNMLNKNQFMTMLEFVKQRSKMKNLMIKQNTSLDIIYVDKKKELTTYRITIDGNDNIHNYISNIHNRKNHVIYKVLLSKMLLDGEHISIIKKMKNMSNIVDIDNYTTRFRLSDELKVSKDELSMLKKLNETNRNDIIFRHKQRITLTLKKDTDITLQIDLTNTKQTYNINKIDYTVPRYELELELLTAKPKKEYLSNIFKEVELIHKVIQQCNFIINTTESKYVLESYRKLLSLDKNKQLRKLHGRKPVSLEIQHAIDKLPNRYAVTDKADGDRYFLIIIDEHVYLISNNMNVKKTGIKLKTKKYNNSILDTEYIYLPKYNRHLIMAFDCLFKSGDDIRQELSFMKRLEHADDIIENNFILGKQQGYKYSKYTKKFNQDDILKFHINEMGKLMNSVNNDIKFEQQYPLIRRKYFLYVWGKSDNEIFKYSKLLWYNYKELNCPYPMDGLLYHPLEQKYIASAKASKYFEYKWKPPTQNSIDFYIKFEKNRDTGKELILFDNSYEGKVKGKPYKICRLHVGKQINDEEKPVLFQKYNNGHEAFLFLENGSVRDIEGNIIQSNTVVEFYYNSDSTKDKKYRWVPMRTRHDKTEHVQKYNKGFGNYIDIAEKVWRSIINPFQMSDINILSNDSKYGDYIEVLKKRIDHSLILSERKENTLQKMLYNMAKPMRNFNNWIRSVVVYTYCNQVYDRNTPQKILDIGNGRGEDIMKYYYGKIDYAVCISKNNDNLTSALDGAVSRYNKLRESHANFPTMYFIQADSSILLNENDQIKALGGMQQKNKSYLQKFFPSTGKGPLFDRINCQFEIQTYLTNDTVWNNFCTNINNTLRDEGYIVITCFDAKSITELLKENSIYTSYYTNNKGEKKKLLEIRKNYDDEQIKKSIGLENAIDIHNALESNEDIYETEYLVDRDFLVNQLKNKCNLELVDSDLFGNQYHIHKDYFDKIIWYEENAKTREFLKNASMFYNTDDSFNRACLDIVKLYRYFVFRKNNSNKPQKGGNYENYNLLDGIKHIVNDEDDRYYYKNNKGTLQKSIYDILINDKYIPSSISQNELYYDLSIDPEYSQNLDKKDINKIIKNIKIEHETSKRKKTVLNGINLLILERDCDNDFIIEQYGKKNKKLMMLYKNVSDYSPIVKKTPSGFKGIFKADDIEIKKIIKLI